MSEPTATPAQPDRLTQLREQRIAVQLQAAQVIGDLVGREAERELANQELGALRAELEAARARIVALEARVVALDEENSSLAQAVDAASGANDQPE